MDITSRKNRTIYTTTVNFTGFLIAVGLGIAPFVLSILTLAGVTEWDILTLPLTIGTIGAIFFFISQTTVFHKSIEIPLSLSLLASILYIITFITTSVYPFGLGVGAIVLFILAIIGTVSWSLLWVSLAVGAIALVIAIVSRTAGKAIIGNQTYLP